MKIIILVMLFVCLSSQAATIKKGGACLTQEQLGQMTTAYYKAHPAKLLALLQNVQSLLKAQEFNGVKKHLLQARTFLLQKNNLPIMGSGHATKALIFFYDVQCAYCHAEYPIIRRWLRSHTDTKVVFVPLPIFGKASLYANKVSLYAVRVGKFKPFIDALEKSNLTEGKLTTGAVNSIAQRVGIQTKALKHFIQSVKLKNTLMQIDQLQSRLGIQGTPFLFVLPMKKNKTPLSAIRLHRGFANAAQLQQLMKG